VRAAFSQSIKELGEGPVREPSTCLRATSSMLAVSPREVVSLKEGRQDSPGDE
jgi:hypothetical protein